MERGQRGRRAMLTRLPVQTISDIKVLAVRRRETLSKLGEFGWRKLLETPDTYIDLSEPEALRSDNERTVTPMLPVPMTVAILDLAKQRKTTVQHLGVLAWRIVLNELLQRD